MAPYHQLRPENAIKRADELVSVGEPLAALQSLADLLSSRKSRFADAASLEPIVFKFLELGIELRKGKVIKEALYHYKKNMQSSNEGLHSVGAVARKFIDLVETKMSAIQAQADAKEESNEDEEEDLEGGVTPENLLISVYEQEQSVGGFNNDDVSSWLRFTWEAYRTTLDLLRNNSQLEITYSGVVSRTMQFCYKYNRKNEFKRLAEMLRQHLDAANYQQQKFGQYTVDLSDPDTLQRYSDQRFQQVNVCVKLELWHEAFRSIEDVHHLMAMSKRTPRPSILANYYENLAKIFFVSGNYLLHAAALDKFYELFLKNPNATAEDFNRHASQFILGALSIQLDDLPIAGFDPQIRLCDLLDLKSKPSRNDLVKKAGDKGVLENADSDVSKLYQLVESEFDVSKIKSELADLLPRLTSKSYFSDYAIPLRNLLVRKSVVAISAQKSSVSLTELYDLLSFAEPLELTAFELERCLIQAAMDDYVSISIDHEKDAVIFAKDPFDSWQASIVEDVEASSEEKGEDAINADGVVAQEEEPVEQVFTRNSEVRFKLTELSKVLKTGDNYETSSYLQRVKLIREELIRQKEEIIKREREIAEQRAKELIEQKKRSEEENKIYAKRAAEERQRRVAEEKAAVESSMEKEAERRAQEKLEREKEAIHEQEMKKLILETNANGVIYIDPKEAKNMTSDKINQMVFEQVAKDKKELTERMTQAFKRLDHTERALRQLELPLLEKDAQTQKDRDLETYNSFKNKLVENAKEEHEKKLALHDRLNKIYGSFREYSSQIAVTKKEQLKKEREAKLQQLEEAKQRRIEDVRQQRYEARVAEVRARLEAEAEEREQREKAEELSRRRAEREKVMKERDEVARRQREVEEMLESRSRGGNLPAPSAPAPAPVAAPEASSGRPMTMAEKMRLKRMQRDAASRGQ